MLLEVSSAADTPVTSAVTDLLPTTIFSTPTLANKPLTINELLPPFCSPLSATGTPDPRPARRFLPPPNHFLPSPNHCQPPPQLVSDPQNRVSRLPTAVTRRWVAASHRRTAGVHFLRTAVQRVRQMSGRHARSAARITRPAAAEPLSAIGVEVPQPFALQCNDF